MSENGLHRIPVMKSALEQIQELHYPAQILKGFNTSGAELTEWVCKYCTTIAEPGTYFTFPCATRKLADDGLAGSH